MTEFDDLSRKRLQADVGRIAQGVSAISNTVTSLPTPGLPELQLELERRGVPRANIGLTVYPQIALGIGCAKLLAAGCAEVLVVEIMQAMIRATLSATVGPDTGDIPSPISEQIAKIDVCTCQSSGCPKRPEQLYQAMLAFEAGAQALTTVIPLRGLEGGAPELQPEMVEDPTPEEIEELITKAQRVAELLFVVAKASGMHALFMV